jgi:hypothetical protein
MTHCAVHAESTVDSLDAVQFTMISLICSHMQEFPGTSVFSERISTRAVSQRPRQLSKALATIQIHYTSSPSHGHAAWLRDTMGSSTGSWRAFVCSMNLGSPGVHVMAAFMDWLRGAGGAVCARAQTQCRTAERKHASREW